ncbi:MAG: peptidyl-prolyl cis-trans isomerase [Candidatus Cloacimonetes bacterium]|nr:peptidyl-prolyl cis-trans isomerase [Candidatus Cloacimonadota bacterium]
MSKTLLFSLGLIFLMACLSLMAADPLPVKVTTDKSVNDTDVWAEYDGGVILRKDIDAKISKLPPTYQPRYRTVDGQIEVLNITATEDVFYQKALQMGLDKDASVLESINGVEKRYLIQEYYKRNVSELVTLTDADLHGYYEQNLASFYLSPYLTIEYIQVTDEAEGLKALAEMKKGTTLAEVSNKYNQNTYAKGLKGIIKNIRMNGNIPGVGNDAELEVMIGKSDPAASTYTGPVQTETGWHIFRVTESIPGRQKTYDEVVPELEQRYRPTKERSMLDAMIESLKAKYNVTVDNDLAAMMDIKERANNDSILVKLVINSSNPALQISVKQLLETFDKIPAQEQIFITKGGGAQQLVEQELMQNIIYIEAQANNYSQYLSDNSDIIAMRRSYLLRKAYELLVVNTVTVSKDDIQARYEKDIDQYSTPGYRSIEAMFFDSKKTADRAWRKYKLAYKSKNETKMKSIISKYSKRPDTAVLDYQYQNGIVTGIGPDADFSKMIWDNPLGYLSPVFTSAKGEFVFFRSINESPKTFKPLADNETKIEAAIKKEKEKAKQDEVTEQLFVEFNMRKYPERVQSQLSADELFTNADDAARQRNFKDAITFYDQIIKSYKNNSDDYKAFFMKAFLIAEEMKNKDLALQLFKDFLVQYPTGDLNESAQFMIDSLEGNLPVIIEEIEE